MRRGTNRGRGQPNDRPHATDAGFNCVLVTPVSVDDRVAVLEGRVIARTSPESTMSDAAGT